MGARQNIRIIQILVIILISCSFIAGTVSAFGSCIHCPILSGRTWSCFYDSCLDSNQSMCPFGNTCGGAEMMVTLGMGSFLCNADFRAVSIEGTIFG